MNEQDAATWMRRMAVLAHDENELPDPRVIWWQAQLLQRQDARERAARPTVIAQWVSLVVAVATVIVLGAANWAGIRSMLAPAGFALWLAAAGAAVLLGIALRVVLSE